MLLKEISYELLLILRAGYISDDERIDLRLLEALIRQYRSQYILSISKSGGLVPTSFNQYLSIPTISLCKGYFSRLESMDDIPRVIVNKYGPMINEIFSDYVDEYSFTIVNRTHLRYAGNGKFNQSILFVAYDNDKLFFKSKNEMFKTVTDVYISAIFENPEDVDGFDVEEDEYPLDLECVNYIKQMFLANDVKLILGQFSDEVNDADGDINGK